MKQLYFCRHGLSEMNKAGLFSGTTETPLAPEGREQARLAGEYAKTLQLDHIIASPFSRTRDTARLIAVAIGYPEAGIELNSLFIERHLGTLEGTKYKAELDMGIDGIADVETTDNLETRMLLAWTYLQSLPYERILVVGHGASGRMLRHIITPSIPFVFDDLESKSRYKFENATIVQLI